MEKKYLNELKISEEFFEAAKKIMKGSIRTSANRLYFALEKAVISYLLFKNIKVPKNHQKIWELSEMHLGKEYYPMLRKLYDLRMQADYGNSSIFVELNSGVLKENLNKVNSLILEIKKKIKEENGI